MLPLKHHVIRSCQYSSRQHQSQGRDQKVPQWFLGKQVITDLMTCIGLLFPQSSEENVTDIKVNMKEKIIIAGGWQVNIILSCSLYIVSSSLVNVTFLSIYLGFMKYISLSLVTGMNLVLRQWWTCRPYQHSVELGFLKINVFVVYFLMFDILIKKGMIKIVFIM